MKIAVASCCLFLGKYTTPRLIACRARRHYERSRQQQQQRRRRRHSDSFVQASAGLNNASSAASRLEVIVERKNKSVCDAPPSPNAFRVELVPRAKSPVVDPRVKMLRLLRVISMPDWSNCGAASCLAGGSILREVTRCPPR